MGENERDIADQPPLFAPSLRRNAHQMRCEYPAILDRLRLLLHISTRMVSADTQEG